VCGRYSLAGPSPAELRGRFPLGETVELRQRFNVAPQDDVACVTTDKEGAPRGELLRWGLVPHWASDPSTGFKMINARAETIEEKPAYRDAFRRFRCLVVADGFYEWERREGLPKLPWHVTKGDGGPFAFAGIWSRWQGPDGTKLRTCSIVTTQANGVLADVHDRMPVILGGPDEEEAWLDAATPVAVLRELLVPLADGDTARRAVCSAVNDARYDGPDCLLDAEPDAPPQPSLF
jgi:putative SOS response-associated peptidase YedK